MSLLIDHFKRELYKGRTWSIGSPVDHMGLFYRSLL